MLPMIRGQQNISSTIPWPTSAPATGLPFLGFIGVGPQTQPVPFYNQENVPFPVTSTLWNHTWSVPPQTQTIQPQSAAGRPILGRRSEPNLQNQKDHKASIDGCTKGRCSLDSLLGKSAGEREFKSSQPPSPIDNWSQNNNQANRKNLNPSPYPMLGLNMSIPPPPIVSQTRSKENEYYFHPIPQNNCNPVELHVTNLDQSIDLREMKKLLMAAFREHVMVLHVSVFVQSDGTLAASVKVPSTQDAQYAISQLHRRKVGFKRIMIAYAHSSAPQNPQFVKNQVVSLLLEVPGHKMPLFTFRELFASRYLSSVSVSDLYRMRDVCVIVEENNGRTITLNPDYRNTPSPASSSETSSNVDLPYCVRHSKQLGCGDKGWAEQEQPSLANVRVSLAVLADRVISLVNSHDNCLPLASMMDCYATQFEPLPVDEQGAPLEHLVTCIAGVELVHSTNKHLRLCPHKVPLDAKMDDSFSMCVSPSLANQVNLFARELVDLLKMQPHCQLMFNRFIPAYHHHFGRQCRVADYGFTKLIDLLETLPHVVQVMGEGNKRVVTLSHRAQVRRFTSDLLRVLKSQASKQLMVSELHQVFERALGRPFDPVDYGLCYLDDLLTQLSANIVLVAGEGSQMTICIPKREQTPDEIERTKQFAVQVIELLSHTPQCSMEFAKFIPAYHHHYGTQCRVADFGFTKLIELFEAIPDVVKVGDDGEGVRKVSLTQTEKLKVLSNQISELVVSRYPPGLPLDDIHPTYLWKYGYALKPSTYGCNNMEELLQKLSSVEVAISPDGTQFITPDDHSDNYMLCLRVLRILWEQSGGRMTIVDLEQSLLHLYQVPCKHEMIENDLRNVVEVTDHWVQLNALQLFARDLYHLLFASDGCMVMNSVEAAYRQTFGAPLVPARLGYTNLQALLQAVGHVAVISGHSNKRLVSINPQLAVVGVRMPPGLLKTGTNNTCSDLYNHSDFLTRRPIAQPLLKGIHNKMNGDKVRQENVWHATTAWTGKHTDNTVHFTDNVDQPMVVNLPEPRTPPSKEECMALLSPAKFLLSASAFPFLPSPPDPSELPKPGQFNLTQVGEGDSTDELNVIDQNKRRLRLAASFHTPIQYK